VTKVVSQGNGRNRIFCQSELLHCQSALLRIYSILWWCNCGQSEEVAGDPCLVQHVSAAEGISVTLESLVSSIAQQLLLEEGHV
jgi:hypothetical protein